MLGKGRCRPRAPPWLLAAGGAGFSLAPALVPTAQERQCRALLNFVHIVAGVVAPTVALVLTEVASATPGWEGTPVGRLEDAVRYWCGGAFSLSRGGRGAAGRDVPSVVRLALVWWLALSLVWMVSVGTF